MLNVFRQDAFSTIQLASAIEKVPYQPTKLGNLGLFEDFPIRTKMLAVEQRAGQLVLVNTSPRGSAPQPRTTEKRAMRYFDVPRLATDFTVQADELQDVREFGTESVLMQMQTEVARRLSGPTGIQRNIEYTWELHRLGAIQGQLLDADGSTINNWFTEFGISAPTEVAFNLSAGTTGLRGFINTNIIRPMLKAAQGAFIEGVTEVHCLCGDTFYDNLVNHPDVVRTFLNWQAAQELRTATAYGDFEFGGVIWHNYRGSDNGSDIAIAADKAKFFFRKAPGVFQVAWAPCEFMPWVNTLGRPFYPIPIFDRDRNSWWKVELYSYPLHICTRPETLYSGRAGT